MQPMATPTAPTAGCAYVETPEGLMQWSRASADAWVGMLQTHKELTREIDAELERKHGLSFSSVELLGRLAAAPDRRLRLSDLAQSASLSLSRVSRLADQLEARGLLERRACPGDGRAVHAVLTDAGLAALREAQATHFAGVQERFFDRLSADEVATLARVFARFAPGAAQSCGAAGTS